MRASFTVVFTVLFAALPANAATAPKDIQVLRYNVSHAIYGNIGTYSNTIKRSRDETTVLTEAHFKVMLFGVVVHREDAERQERWRGGRLTFFSGKTIKNGQSLEVRGEARGDAFIIISSPGTISASTDVQPANPWSEHFRVSHTMMHVDTGAIERVEVSPGALTTVMINGAALRTRLYTIDGKSHYKIWLSDPQKIPVMFSADDDSGEITFTLAANE